MGRFFIYCENTKKRFCRCEMHNQDCTANTLAVAAEILISYPFFYVSRSILLRQNCRCNPQSLQSSGDSLHDPSKGGSSMGEEKIWEKNA